MNSEGESMDDAEKHEAHRIGMIGLAAGMKCLANITQGLYREQEPFSTDGNWADGGWQIAWEVKEKTLRIWGTAPLRRRVEWTMDNDEWDDYDVGFQMAQFISRELCATTVELDSIMEWRQNIPLGDKRCDLDEVLDHWHSKYRNRTEQ